MDKSEITLETFHQVSESEALQGAGDLLDEAHAEEAIIDAIEMAEQLQDSDLIHPDNIVLDLDDFDERLNSLGKICVIMKTLDATGTTWIATG